MTEAIGSVFIEITLDDKKYTAQLQAVGKESEKAGKAVGDNLSKGANQATTSFQQMESVVKGLMYKLAALYSVHQLTSFVKETALAAARFETLGIVMTQVAKINGVSTQTIKEQEMALRKQGISMTETRDNLTKMMQAQIDTAQASKLARIAQDAAVIGDINSSAAFGRMIHGIKSGQTEILRNIGLQVSNEAAYKKLAESLKITTGALTENQKMQARVNAVLEEGAKITGVYEAAMDTAGKKLNSFKRYIDDFKVKMGEAFGPAMVILVDSATEAMKKLQAEISSPKAQEAMKSLANDLAKVVKILIEEAPAALIKLTGALEGLIKIYNVLPAEIVGAAGIGIFGAIVFGGPAGATLAGIAAAIILMTRLRKEAESAGNSMSDLIEEKTGIKRSSYSPLAAKEEREKMKLTEENKLKGYRKLGVELGYLADVSMDVASEAKKANKEILTLQEVIDKTNMSADELSLRFLQSLAKTAGGSSVAMRDEKRFIRKKLEPQEEKAQLESLKEYYSSVKFQDAEYYDYAKKQIEEKRRTNISARMDDKEVNKIYNEAMRKLDDERINFSLKKNELYYNTLKYDAANYAEWQKRIYAQEKVEYIQKTGNKLQAEEIFAEKIKKLYRESPQYQERQIQKEEISTVNLKKIQDTSSAVIESKQRETSRIIELMKYQKASEEEIAKASIQNQKDLLQTSTEERIKIIQAEYDQSIKKIPWDTSRIEADAVKLKATKEYNDKLNELQKSGLTEQQAIAEAEYQLQINKQKRYENSLSSMLDLMKNTPAQATDEYNQLFAAYMELQAKKLEEMAKEAGVVFNHEEWKTKVKRDELIRQAEDLYTFYSSAKDMEKEAYETSLKIIKLKAEAEIAKGRPAKQVEIVSTEQQKEAQKKLDLKTGDMYAGFSIGVKQWAETAETAAEGMARVTKQAFNDMTSALTKFVRTGKMDWRSLADSIVDELIRIQIQQAIVYAASGGKEGSGGLLGAALKIGGAAISAYSGWNAAGGDLYAASVWQHGGAFDKGRITPFASGGIFSKPTLFPMANGTGLMGEAGPEAVMPLTRGADGKLGVKSKGGESGSNGEGATNIIIYAVDAKSFEDMCKRNPAAITGPILQSLRDNKTRTEFKRLVS